MDRQASCEERVEEALASTMEELSKHWRAYQGVKFADLTCPCGARLYNVEEEELEDTTCEKCGMAYHEGDDDENGQPLPLWVVEDCGEYNEDSLYDYGLGFDYVPKGTFTDQDRGYFRWQFSWGGPSDELRFYVDHEWEPYQVEYWFLDWGDGASRRLSGADLKLVEELWDWLLGAEAPQSEYKKAGCHADHYDEEEDPDEV